MSNGKSPRLINRSSGFRQPLRRRMPYLLNRSRRPRQLQTVVKQGGRRNPQVGSNRGHMRVPNRVPNLEPIGCPCDANKLGFDII
jgi:hypothetical protein